MDTLDKPKKPVIFLAVGTRPEVIKLAPVYWRLKQLSHIETRWVATGQHRQMLEQAESVFGIVPDIDLDIMRPNQTPLEVVHEAACMLENLWKTQRPDMIVVQGDTATALAAAMAAFYQRIPVAHVEAGLRSHIMNEPFPEEAHRRMIAAMTTLHFAPTCLAAENLLREGIPPETVFTVGNTVVDALMQIPQKTDYRPKPEISSTSRWLLVTAHRRENHGVHLENICKILLEIRDSVEDVEIIFPVHLNPNVQSVVKRYLRDEPRIHLLPPVDYFEFIQLIGHSYLIMTDSGGIQEEAPSFHVPVLVLRNQTERPEAVESGMARLVGTNRKTVAAAAIELLTNPAMYQTMKRGNSPFGDGKSSARIARVIDEFLAHHTLQPRAYLHATR